MLEGLDSSGKHLAFEVALVRIVGDARPEFLRVGSHGFACLEVFTKFALTFFTFLMQS